MVAIEELDERERLFSVSSRKLPTINLPIVSYRVRAVYASVLKRVSEITLRAMLRSTKGRFICTVDLVNGNYYRGDSERFEKQTVYECVLILSAITS